MATNEFIAILTVVVNKCRDILRREGITGMDSMKHLTLYTLVRFIDEAECLKLNVPSKFAWERFIEFTDSSDNHQASYNLLYCKNGATEDLISYFDSLFGTKNFNYKLQNPTSHVEIINEFKKLDLKHLEGQIDVLGSIYEIHLGTGSNKSAMRDLGQFFTERSVCKYMVGLCNPKILPDGRAESILDPTMGTGGFLTSYIQHLGSSPKWSEMQNDIAGCDIDEFVMAVGRINLYLQTGIMFNRIIHRNSLTNDVGEETHRRKFKNILANMPFGVKNLKFKDCCARVKALGIDGTKSEPLFLQLMMASLDDGGRCAVVVPDGAIVNQSKCHNLTRKYLLEHFELKRVIKMKGQFFSNTGIQPSILFFENTGKPTSVTQFWEVEKNSAGVITETLAVSVPIEKIDTDSYSLDMRRYMEVVVSEKVSAFPMVKLGDIMVKQSGKVITLEKAEDGVIPLYSASIKIRSHKEPSFDSTPSIVQACVGSNLEECIHYVSEPFAATGNLWVLRSNAGISVKYVYYYLKLTKCILTKVNHSVLPKVNYSEFVDISIPLPPLEIQQQIVAELDSIYDNAHKASQMATSIKAQMASVMKSVGMRGYERKKIGDLCDLLSGKGGNYQSDGDIYPYYDSNGITGMRKEHCFDGEYIITARKMSIGSVHYATGKFWSSDNTINICVKDTSTLISRFFYYWLLNNNKVLKDLSSGVKPGIRKSDVAEILIPLPPLGTQQQILTILNEMEGERKSLEQMASKAEERAKFVLDGYLN
jgi:type I restriction-modification system DNA methylase subunit/restriction endonuclease S subunit